MMLGGSSDRFALAISKDTRSWVSLKLEGRFGQERGRPSYELVPEKAEPMANQDGSSCRSAAEQTKFAEYVRAGTVTAVWRSRFQGSVWPIKDGLESIAEGLRRMGLFPCRHRRETRFQSHPFTPSAAKPHLLLHSLRRPDYRLLQRSRWIAATLNSPAARKLEAKSHVSFV
jgi:hypothetical protein